MTEKRVKIHNILDNQLPSYVREEFPLVAEFLKQYYISQEFQGASIDLANNIDQYIKLDSIKGQAESTNLTNNISFLDDVIPVSSTLGFPDYYGLIQIGDEIITYTGKTSTSFIGCIRGFSGTTSYTTDNKPDQLVFQSSSAEDHSNGDEVKNLTSLFLKTFFSKIKYQLTPGFEERDFYPDLDKYLFVKQSKDFYSTRGTENSFKILFKVLYGEDVSVIKPRDYLLKPSDAQYQVTNDLVVESISGNPLDLVNSTLFQDEYGSIQKGYTSISNAEKIISKKGKEYFKLSFDGGYDKDIRVKESLYGNLSIHPKTKIIGKVVPGYDTIDVDSTVGFPNEGELYIKYDNGIEGTINYTSKNLNQFHGCNNIEYTINDATEVSLNVYAYGTSNKNPNEIIKVRVNPVLSSVNIDSNSYYYKKDEKSIIRSLGIIPKNSIRTNNWFFNTPVSIESDSLELLDETSSTYELKTKVDHNFRVGDKIKLISNSGEETETFVSSVITNRIITITEQGLLDTTKRYVIKKLILKVDSQQYPSVSNEIANVQNIYNNVDGETLISSPSIPSYGNLTLKSSSRKVTFSGSFVGDIFKITSNRDHGFYTGDVVYYSSTVGSLFDNGVYYLQRVDKNSVRFAKSRSNIYNSKFVSLENTVTVSNSTIEEYEAHSLELQSQKLLRKISDPIETSEKHETESGTTGILINGVEILNYKSKDKIYYGEIEKIEVTSSGTGYDVINPPELRIEDSVGVGASGYCSVSGSLKQIRVIDPGFDYIETPKVKISGGNGVGAQAFASLKLVDHQVFFNAEPQSSQVNITNNTIGFTTYHKFKNAERVVYRTNSQEGVGGISTNSSYFVSLIDEYSVRFHSTYQDALSGINTISLTSFGVGNHYIESYNKKSVLASINVQNEGANYQNKKRTIKSSGISTSSEIVTIKDHDFKSGEIIRYTAKDVNIEGLVSGKDYYVTRVNDDQFRLSEFGIDQLEKDFYYKNKKYINLLSTGEGIHEFNYPPISVELIGRVGISSINGQSFEAKIQPIFRGEITSIHLEENGVGYGSSEILNFNRTPQILLGNGSDCKVTPIINNGKIEDILIINPGFGYVSPPDISVLSISGSGAVLTPVLKNGSISEIKIIEGGSGYDTNDIIIDVNSPGTGAKFSPIIKTWTVNLFNKLIKNIKNDDGVIFKNPISNYGLQYGHLYAPRKLRENIYSIEIGGRILYGKTDLIFSNGNEISSSNHSPIIGWAYDGNPIYGPYGYSKKDGGKVTRMKSGYVLKDQQDRPPFENGFFVEDYEYKNLDDDSALDENNGRFCVTPDFPNGVYAYFATIDSASSEDFGGYRKPVFPYLIGNYYKSKPIEFNFDNNSNQDDFDLNSSNWIRNTKHYNIFEDESSYGYFNIPNNLNQKITIKYASSGSVDNVDILSGGSNYKVNDKIILDEENTGGFGFSAKVSRVGGKTVNSISVASTTLYGAEIYPEEGSGGVFYIQTENPHNIKSGDLINITGINTAIKQSKTFYSPEIVLNTFSLSNPSGVGTVGSTGIVTYFSVSGNISFSNSKENDVFLIGEEKVKILNIDKKSSRIRVIRSYDGTVGTAHSYSDILYEVPRRISLNLGKQNSITYKPNKEIYFDPKESVGLGSIFGVGITSTLLFSNPGVGITQIEIPTKSLYLPNHNLKTGDSLVYSTYGGEGILVSTNGITTSVLSDQSTVYVARISEDLIGISTVKVGLGSTGTFVGVTSSTSDIGTLYFLGIGTGNYHSFKTNYPKITGNISRNIVTVETKESHELVNGDEVFVNVNPKNTINYILAYNDYNRKILINPKSFSSSDVNVQNNTIRINNHEFKSGQKVLYTSESPSSGLENNKEYYVVVFDNDNIRLTDLYVNDFNFNVEIIDIGSQSSGTLSLINPEIKVYKDSTVNFDISDSSLSYSVNSIKYPAFKLNFYEDLTYTKLFEKNENSSNFQVKRFGSTGISTDARVLLEINSNSPKKLFYKLDVLDNGDIPLEKVEVTVDDTVESYGQVTVVDSLYNGKHKITSIGSSEFTYPLEFTPENSSYNNQSSILDYETNSSHTTGNITKIKVENKGQNYYSLPSFSEVQSETGSGSLISIESKSIGKVIKTNINDIGFDFSSDFTLKPNIIFPQIAKINALSSFDSIGISSVGRGYNTAPKLVVLDGETEDFISEADIRYSVGDTKVTILNNTYRLNKVTPKIIPIHNPNGVGISSISYNPTTKDVTAILSVRFSLESLFPFEVNDRILIENVSVGVGSDGKGYNSENYNYKLFTIKSIDQNIGGYGSITYSLEDVLGLGEEPGNFDIINSSGRIIPEKYFPIFDISLKNTDFLEGETIKSANLDKIIGTVESWDSKNNYLKVLTREYLSPDEILIGLSSKTNGKIDSVIEFSGFLNLGPYSKVSKGWASESGILNNDLQRIQDNFYYQNFSYSLKSKVPYDTWNDVVGSLNHTAGFKKFGDYQCEPSLSEIENNILKVGISTNVIDVTSDVVETVNLNCVYDFDLVRENSLKIGNRVLSNQVDFGGKILTDYIESVGNRVLIIDDFSGTFNSYPRPTRYSEVERFIISDRRCLKYVTYIRDKRYIDQKQINLITLVHDNSFGYINQYGRLETTYDLGSFDFSIDGIEGVISFYPSNYSVNNYDINLFAYNIKEDLTGVGSTSLGGITDIIFNTTQVSAGINTIVTLDTSYTSAKILAEIITDDGYYQFDELSYVHNGTDIKFIDYGQLTTDSSGTYSTSGFGTYNAYISGSNVIIDFIPNAGVAATVSTVQVAMKDNSVSGIGTFDIKYVKFESRSTSIASSTTPTQNVISEYSNDYSGGYFIVQVSDYTNNEHQLSELVVVSDTNEVYLTEFANIETDSSLGTISAVKVSEGTQIVFTPLPNIDVEVKVYFNSLRSIDDANDIVSYNDNTFLSAYGEYYGTDIDIKRSFDINHGNYPVFERVFNGEDASIVNVENNTITIPNHFFVSGEQVLYTFGKESFPNGPIGITTTDFGVGIGTTDKLTNPLFVIKVDNNMIKLAKSAEDALKLVPLELDLNSLGIGSDHRITSTNQNKKVLISIDNVIQSPITQTNVTSGLSTNALSTEDSIFVDSITNFFGGDLIKIGDEIMKVTGVGIGSTNALRVIRPWVGTEAVGHSTGAKVTKVIGNYNIVNNTINFASPPYGNVPLSSTTNPPNDRDWVGISTSSSFHGRVFLKNGVRESVYETYHKNYILDDISFSFDGIEKSFALKSDGSDITGVSTNNAIILINDIFQTPGFTNSYTLEENLGITSITFNGTDIPVNDINASSVPIGGVIISVASSAGFGYQPLISAGGTAIVSSAGTIQSISIGNSGSGYRSGIQTSGGVKIVDVRVGVVTQSTETPNIEYIGTASVSNGSIVSIAITNPGFGYTSSNPPKVIIDPPLSYSNIPLVYSNTSSGIGSNATIDIVISQDSSVVDFRIDNTGNGYNIGDILTVPTGGLSGIPTNSSPQFEEFSLRIEKTFSDKFTGWTIGDIQIFDNIEYLFDGERLVFPLFYKGDLVSILAQKGSSISIQDTILVFVNDILQIPNEGYLFNGGSSIEFTEPPKQGDICTILFYRGNGDSDVIFRNVVETIKNGDDVILTYDPELSQTPELLEDPRTVIDVRSTNLIDTNPYYGPGNTDDQTLRRPMNWCRQTEDKIINETEISKSRTFYEPLIYPFAYIIKPVGINSTIIYVDNLRPFFNPQNENNVNLDFQNGVTIISQGDKVAANATSVVSLGGTLSSIIINDGGFGYTYAPEVIIESPVGLGTTQRATAVASINSGIVTNITITFGGNGYSQSNPPKVLIESPSTSRESNLVDSFSGDSGIIVGFGTTTIYPGETVYFDTYIPGDSYLRDSSVVGSAITVSSLSVDDYFMIYNSNIGFVGNNLQSLDKDDNPIGTSSTCLDNVYQVYFAENVEYDLVGVGTTTIRRIYSKVNGITTTTYGESSSSSYFGMFSWGKIDLAFRSKNLEYESYTSNGLLGISSSALVVRNSPLKYNNYLN